MTDTIKPGQTPPIHRVSTPTCFGNMPAIPVPTKAETLERDAVFDDFAGGPDFSRNHDAPRDYYRAINVGYWLGALAAGGCIWTLVLTKW